MTKQPLSCSAVGQLELQQILFVSSWCTCFLYE